MIDLSDISDNLETAERSERTESIMIDQKESSSAAIVTAPETRQTPAQTISDPAPGKPAEKRGPGRPQKNPAKTGGDVGRLLKLEKTVADVQRRQDDFESWINGVIESIIPQAFKPTTERANPPAVKGKGILDEIADIWNN